MRRMQQLLTSLGFIFIRLISYLPMSMLRLMGNCLGIIGYYCVSKRRNIGITNLTLCFPSMSIAEKKRIIKEHFKYLMVSALEYSVFFFASQDKIKQLVSFKNSHYVTEYYKKQPIIILYPHFVGLDLGALRMTGEFAGCSIYATQKNPYLTDRIKQARLRFMKDYGGELFPRNDGLRGIIKHLKAHNDIFYYLPDQDFGERDSIYVPFFAQKTCATVNILPRIAKLTNAVIIPAFVYRNENDTYEVEFFPAWDNYPSDNYENDVGRINQFVEHAVTKYLEQYFWLHKRFKTQPNLPKGFLYK